MQVRLKPESVAKLTAAKRKRIVDTPVQEGFLEFRLPDVVLCLMTETSHGSRHNASEVEIEMKMDIADPPIILGIVLSCGEIPCPGNRLKNPAGALNEQAWEEKSPHIHPFTGEVISFPDIVFKDLITRLLCTQWATQKRWNEEDGSKVFHFFSGIPIRNWFAFERFFCHNAIRMQELYA